MTNAADDPPADPPDLMVIHPGEPERRPRSDHISIVLNPEDSTEFRAYCKAQRITLSKGAKRAMGTHLWMAAAVQRGDTLWVKHPDGTLDGPVVLDGPVPAIPTAPPPVRTPPPPLPHHVPVTAAAWHMPTDPGETP